MFGIDNENKLEACYYRSSISFSLHVFMAFFGFEQSDLEQEKLNFKKGDVHQSDDVAVYTWGEEGYDGLGDLLQEGGDELNNETFGGVGSVGESVLLSLQSDQGSDSFSQGKTLTSLIQLYLTPSAH